jgi:hypothetical protein
VTDIPSNFREQLAHVAADDYVESPNTLKQNEPTRESTECVVEDRNDKLQIALQTLMHELHVNRLEMTLHITMTSERLISIHIYSFFHNSKRQKNQTFLCVGNVQSPGEE